MLVAGPEPKMTETLGPAAELLAADLVIDDSFRETDARWLAHDEFLATVARLFASPASSPAPGWERSCDAGARLLAGIRRRWESGPDGDVVVCSGGRALTSLLVSLAVIAPDRAFAYWQTIGMPDLAVLDIPTSGTPAVVRHFAADV